MDDTVTVPTTPGASKKHNQRKRQWNEQAHKIVKVTRIEHCKSDSDSDFM